MLCDSQAPPCCEKAGLSIKPPFGSECKASLLITSPSSSSSSWLLCAGGAGSGRDCIEDPRDDGGARCACASVGSGAGGREEDVDDDREYDPAPAGAAVVAVPCDDDDEAVLARLVGMVAVTSS